MPKGRYAMIHNKKGCREVAFFYDRPTQPGEPFKTEFALYPDGTIPTKGQPVLCHNCGEVVIGSELVQVFQADVDLKNGPNVILVDAPMQFGTLDC